MIDVWLTMIPTYSYYNYDVSSGFLVIPLPRRAKRRRRWTQRQPEAKNVGPWVELKLTEGGNGLGGLGVKGVFLCVWYVTAVEWKMDDM